MSRSIVFLKGSPSTASRSAIVADAVASELGRTGIVPVTWSLADFDPADVFFARSQAPAIARFIDAVKAASALVLSTPVYKAAYSGALKAVVDLIPPDALVGRPVLGIATAKLSAHATEVDRAFRGLAAFFKARALETLVVLDGDIQVVGAVGRVLGASEERVRQAASALLQAVDEPVTASATP